MPVVNHSISIVFILLLFFTSNAQDELFIEALASGFNSPVDIAHAGDERLYIVEKRGYIRIMDTTGQVLPNAFLDIDAQVSSNGERGLLGLVFHPQYSDNGWFYLNYTNNSGNTVVARFTRDTADANLADPGSEEILLTINQPFSNHNAGDLAFGPDGYLYVGTGDGGDGGDPGDRSQNTMELLGKMLRLDVDNGLPYSIPADNPFVENDTILSEIWSIGLRNPWRYSFDRETGDLYIADVGQGAFEEVNFEPAGSAGGLNYGWRCYEANNPFNLSDCQSADAYTPPVFSYPHEGFGCGGSITGGYVYRGSEYPDLVGTYVCVDYCKGKFRAFEMDSMGNAQNGRVVYEDSQEAFLTFGEDVSGELYVATGSGRIYQVGMTPVSRTVDPEVIQIQVFPNPTSSSIMLLPDDESISSQTATIDIYNTAGIRVLSTTLQLSDRLDITTLPDGIYAARVEVGTIVYSARFTVQK